MKKDENISPKVLKISCKGNLKAGYVTLIDKI